VNSSDFNFFNMSIELWLFCLTPLSTIFRLYRDRVLVVEETGVPATNTKRKKGLKMLKGQLESVYRRRTDNGQKKKGQKGKQRSTKHYTERIEQHDEVNH
jgi:hypothetical protein